MRSVSCIIPLYGILCGNNWIRFQKLISSIKTASECFPKGDFELILINDEPDVNIYKQIVQHFVELNILFEWSYYSNEKNLGQGKTRNKAADIAKKEYLHFIDQDDYISPNFYSEFMHLYSEDIGLFISRPYFYLERIQKTQKAYTFALNRLYSDCTLLKNLWFLLVSNLFYSPGQVLIKKNIFIRNGGFNALMNYGSDDYGLFYKLVFYNDIKCFYMSKAVFFYRIHTNQNSRVCNINKSVEEFLTSLQPMSFKELLIQKLKLSPHFRTTNKLLYTVFFKKAKL